MIWSTVPPRNFEDDLRTLAGSTPHLDLAAQPLHPLSHGRESHASPDCPTIEAPPVVLHLRHDTLAPLVAQRHCYALRPRVTPGVGERLLDDAQDFHTYHSGQTFGETPLDGEYHLSPGHELPVQLHQRLD